MFLLDFEINEVTKLRPRIRQSPSCVAPVVVIPCMTDQRLHKLLFLILILLQCLSGLSDLYFRSSLLESLSFYLCLHRLLYISDLVFIDYGKSRAKPTSATRV